ncbi:helix-turn-helix transcriptional regulator [Cysteiniphilum halobium]|uniref:helix-turn-helix transcriptional regulator n=1 Tax=Cysteiniphilum halobium TaxID=2219059 RepID=UPI000E65838B|nr:helix-turn-helix transcriptional regulator [Cysteiniphilum halobium]
MPTIQEVHKWSFAKHRNALKRLMYPVIDKLYATGLSYTRLFANGEVINVPVLEHDIYGAWLEGSPTKDPAFCLSNLTKIPKMIWYHELSAFLCSDDQSSYAFIRNINKFDYCLTYLKYNDDNSISRLSVLTSYTVMGFFSDKQLLLDQCIAAIESYLFDCKTRIALEFDISNDISPIIFKGTNENIVVEFLSRLTTQELACLKLIYTGYFESKEIALKLHKSPRTIEGTIARLSQKLSCNNKYELAVKISKMHDVMRCLMMKGW